LLQLDRTGPKHWRGGARKPGSVFSHLTKSSLIIGFVSLELSELGSGLGPAVGLGAAGDKKSNNQTEGQQFQIQLLISSWNLDKQASRQWYVMEGKEAESPI